MYLEEFNNFKPKDFLKFSEKLDKKFDEFDEIKSATSRSIMSRLYYACFLYVRQWASMNLNYNSNPIKDHRQLPNFIAKRGPFDDELNKNISTSLKILKQLRQQSDYDLKIPKRGTYKYGKWIFPDTDYAFKLARQIFNSFENLK